MEFSQGWLKEYTYFMSLAKGYWPRCNIFFKKKLTVETYRVFITLFKAKEILQFDIVLVVYSIFMYVERFVYVCMYWLIDFTYSFRQIFHVCFKTSRFINGTNPILYKSNTRSWIFNAVARNSKNLQRKMNPYIHII